MKRMLSLLLMLLTLSMTCPALAEENVVAPEVAFRSSFIIGQKDHEVSVTIRCLNKSSVTVPEKYLELRNHRGEVLERAFWRNPQKDLTFSVYVTEEMLGGQQLSVYLDGEKINTDDAYAAFYDSSVPRVKLLNPSEPAVSAMIVCAGATENQLTDMLNVLDKYGVKATFFITGDFLRNTPEYAKRILEAGHEIGSHGNNLIDMTQVTYDRARHNISVLNDECEELLGFRPRLFYAHKGATNGNITAIARAEGMEECLYTIDARDWSESYRWLYNQMVSFVTSDRVVSGSLIQFHINGYHSAEVLDAGLDNWINVRGYRVVTISELMALSGREYPAMPDIPEAE